MTDQQSGDPERRERDVATDEQSFWLLMQLYRIASFHGGEENSQDHFDLRIGYHGRAYGPTGEATCSVHASYDIFGEELFKDQDRVEVAVLRFQGHSYHIFAEIDRVALADYGYEYQELAEALSDLTDPIRTFSSRPSDAFEPEDYISFMPRFVTQHLRVLKDVPSENDLFAGPKDPVHNSVLTRMVDALERHDENEAAEILREHSRKDEDEISLELLRKLEIAATQEVGALEIKKITMALTREYFAVVDTSF